MTCTMLIVENPIGRFCADCEALQRFQANPLNMIQRYLKETAEAHGGRGTIRCPYPALAEDIEPVDFKIGVHDQDKRISSLPPCPVAILATLGLKDLSNPGYSITIFESLIKKPEISHRVKIALQELIAHSES